MLHHSDIQRKNCDQTNKQMRQYIDVEAEILGFSNKDVPVYVKKHLGDSKKAKALLSLAQTTRLTNLDCFGHFQNYGILKTPLLLNMFCVLYNMDTQAPNLALLKSKTGIYRAIRERCVARECLRKQKPPVSVPKETVLKLGELAWQGLQTDNYLFEKVPIYFSYTNFRLSRKDIQL